MIDVQAVPSSRLKWGATAWFTAVLIACYAPVLLGLLRQWSTDDDMGHGFFVPVVAGFLTWQRRDAVLKLAPRINWWGLVLVVCAALESYAGKFGAELFLSRTAFLFSVIGVILFLRGTATVRALAFPLFLLFFMVPIPTILYSKITFPLQLLASQLAQQGLTLLDIPALREGNILELADQRLSVVEACSGIRSLLSLTFLSLVYGYFFEPRKWLRVVLFAATIPIAITANALRVTLTGVLANFRPELAEGFFHAASGWVIFMVALVFLVVFHRILTAGLALLARH